MKRIVIVVVVFVLALTAGGIAYYSRGGQTETELVVSSVYEDKVSGTGLFVRDESDYSIDGDVNMYAYVKDGSRVGNGEKIAALYSDESSRGLIDKLTALDDQIATAGVSVATVDISNPVAVEGAIKDSAEQLSRLIAQKDVAGMATIRNEMASLGNNSAGVQQEQAAQLASLKDERDKVEQQIASTYTPVYAEKAGVFVSKTDGHEAEITPSILKDINVESWNNYLQSARKAKDTKNQYKIVDNFTWYIALMISEDEINSLKEGSNVELRLSDSDRAPVDASVDSISEVQNGKVVIVCSSSASLEGLYQLRTAKVDLIKNTYEGLKVNKNALRVVDDKTGVYIDSNGVAKFKEVSILINGDDVAIIKEDAGNANALSRYDKVIVGGKDIYEGKNLN